MWAYIVTLLVWTVLDCNAVPWCAAGGTYSLVGGQWLDATRPFVCQQCPIADPSIVVCNDNKVETQPGYYALYTTDSRRANSYSTIKVLNLIVLRLTPVFDVQGGKMPEFECLQKHRSRRLSLQSICVGLQQQRHVEHQRIQV